MPFVMSHKSLIDCDLFACALCSKGSRFYRVIFKHISREPTLALIKMCLANVKVEISRFKGEKK